MDARRDAKTGAIVIMHHEVTDKEARSICADGHPVHVLNIYAFEGNANEDRGKSGVPSQPSLPSEFAIYRPWWWHAGFAGPVYGNFWVPNVRPTYHNWHVVDFTMTPWNFHNAGLNAHMVTGVYFHTNSNMTQDFHAKGMWLSAGPASQCNNMGRAVIQTWDIVLPGYVNGPVHPDSCSSWDSVSAVRVIVGANHNQPWHGPLAQDVAYFNCAPGGTCPPTPQQAPFIVANYATQNFNPALQRGVMFLVAGDNGTAPWTLQFSNVISYSGP